MKTKMMRLVSGICLALSALGAGWAAFGKAAPQLDANKLAAAAGTKTTTTQDGVVRLLFHPLLG